MINQALRIAIIKILLRLDGTPLRETTLRSEVEIAVATPITTTDFMQTMESMIEQSLVFKSHDLLFNEPTYSLTQLGREISKHHVRANN